MIANSSKALLDQIGPSIEEPLCEHGGLGSVVPIVSAGNVADDMSKALVRNTAGRPIAVLLCSARESPDLVLRGVENARNAKRLLGPGLGGPVLHAWATGRVDGLSYALWPYCPPIAGSRLGWLVKRRGLRRSVLTWLRKVTTATTSDAAVDALGESFEAPLLHIRSRSWSRPGIRMAATEALRGLTSGEWRPRFVLEHNDLWLGNLLHVKGGEDRENQWGFVVIDWPGARVQGYAMYDLLRVAPSLDVSRRMLTREVAAHCSLLGCGGQDAMSYLLAGLGRLGMHLEHFPEDRYVGLVEQLFDEMESHCRLIDRTTARTLP